MVSKLFKNLLPLIILFQVACKKEIANNSYEPLVDIDDSSSAGKLATAIKKANKKETVILKADRPWEMGGLVYFSVYQEDSIIQLYYLCDDGNKQRHLCYAYSEDGINFIKPNLNLVAFDGSRDNNILNLSLDQASFFYDSSSEYPFKFLGMGNDYKLHYAYSKNGINFKLNNAPLVDYFSDSQNQIIYDPAERKYKYYLRNYQFDDKIKHPSQNSYYYRAVCYFESNILQEIRFQGTPILHPSSTSLFSLSSELPTIFNFDRSYSEGDIYKPSVVRYKDNIYLAYPSVFHHYTSAGDGFCSVSLYISSNGKDFKLVKSDLIKDEPHSYYLAPGYASKKGVLYNYYWKVYTTHANFKRVSEYVAIGYEMSPEELAVIE